MAADVSTCGIKWNHISNAMNPVGDPVLLATFERDNDVARYLGFACVCRLYRARCRCRVYYWRSWLLDHAELFTRNGQIVALVAHRYGVDEQKLGVDEQADLDGIVAEAARHGVQLIARVGSYEKSWYHPRTVLFELWRADALNARAA